MASSPTSRFDIRFYIVQQLAATAAPSLDNMHSKEQPRWFVCINTAAKQQSLASAERVARCSPHRFWSEPILFTSLLLSPCLQSHLQELGGPDTGIIQAMANSLGQLGGSLAPPLAFALHRRSGAWSGVYFFSAVSVLLSGLFYRSVIELEPARNKLTQRRHS